MTADKGISASCRLHLIEVENISGPLLSKETLAALETSVADALNARFPGSSCRAGVLEGNRDTDERELAARLSDEGRPGFVYSLSFFPRSNGLMLLATAYRPNGQFAAFSSTIKIDTVLDENDRLEAAVDRVPPAPTKSADTPRANIEVPSSSTATFGNLAAIGTPAEIAAIRAKKLALMPDDPEPAPPPEIGLRIDIGSAIAPTTIKELARAFLLAQPKSSLSEPVIEDQDTLKLSGQADTALKGIEILDGDRDLAFDKLFRGDVDLVVASKPISQSDYDRFADAFGVDMRSGAGETVIGIDATGLIVHPDNKLPSLTKKLAAEIFNGDVASWDQNGVANSGLVGPIRTLAPAYDIDLQDGYAIRPDLMLRASAKIADLVEINPLSIGIGNMNIGKEGTYRSLAIEECGIVYPSDDFFLRTEDHPLARRLFLYSNPAKGNPFRNGFLFFATSEPGQELIGRHAIDLDVAFGGPERTRERIGIINNQPSVTPRLKNDLIGTINGARRLSTTFRFRFDSYELRLDQHAARDLANLIRLSQREEIDPSRLMLLGFADANGDATYNEALSLERAQAIAKRLRTYGIPIPAANVRGFGEEAPIACNTRPDGTEDKLGTARNRRVEVWLRDSLS